MFISVRAALKPKPMMNEPKTAAQHNLESGGFYGNEGHEWLTNILDDSALLAFEKLRHKRRVKKSGKFKPKREN